MSVTEKLLLAMLAGGGVPVYWGDPTVSRLFHPSAFIDCSTNSSSSNQGPEQQQEEEEDLLLVSRCADRVAAVYHNHRWAAGRHTDRPTCHP